MAATEGLDSMLKIIDLDNLTTKDGDSVVFTLTVGFEKLGLTVEEMADLIRQKAGAPAKAAAKKTARGRTAAPNEATGDAVADTDATPAADGETPRAEGPLWNGGVEAAN